MIIATGAAAPRAARIGITLQAPMAAALYWVRPPGRRGAGADAEAPHPLQPWNFSCWLPSRFGEQLPQAHHEEESAEAAAEQLHVQPGGQPGGQGGAGQPGQGGGPDGFAVDIPVLDVGGQGGGGGGQEVEQVDPLGQVLGPGSGARRRRWSYR